MIDLMSRLGPGPDGPVLRGSGLLAADVVRGFLEGAPVAGIEPADVLAALAMDALGPEGSLGPPLIRGGEARPKLAAAISADAFSRLLPGASRPARLALAAGFLQAFDAWEASHESAQEADDLGDRETSAYWHGIAHRREPDAGNAAYWFRRVGRHPGFGPLSGEAASILDSESVSAPRLIRGGSWDPLAFIAFAADSRSRSAEERAARRIQRAEMKILLGISAQATGMIDA